MTSTCDTPPVAERLKRAYPTLPGRAGVGSIPANSDALNVPSFRRWRFEKKLSSFYDIERYIFDIGELKHRYRYHYSSTLTSKVCDLRYRIMIPSESLRYRTPSILTYDNEGAKSRYPSRMGIRYRSLRYQMLRSISWRRFDFIAKVHRALAPRAPAAGHRDRASDRDRRLKF